MTSRVLFVCAMNVCRSPVAAYTFAAEIAEAGTLGEWVVDSCGTHVNEPAPMCSVGAHVVLSHPGPSAGSGRHASPEGDPVGEDPERDEPEGDASAKDGSPELTPAERDSEEHDPREQELIAHESKRLDPALLAEYDLILTATRAERGAIAAASPSSRAKTFTVREAELLSRPPLVQGAFGTASRGHQAQDPTLAGFADLLHRRRGIVPLPRPRPARRIMWRTVPAVDPLDVVDVHGDDGRGHLRQLQELQAIVRTLHGRISRFMNAAAPAGDVLARGRP